MPLRCHAIDAADAAISMMMLPCQRLLMSAYAAMLPLIASIFSFRYMLTHYYAINITQCHYY
jgi:hypothetical protein